VNDKFEAFFILLGSAAIVAVLIFSQTREPTAPQTSEQMELSDGH
jgi:hypothetical protein